VINLVFFSLYITTNKSNCQDGNQTDEFIDFLLHIISIYDLQKYKYFLLFDYFLLASGCVSARFGSLTFAKRWLVCRAKGNVPNVGRLSAFLSCGSEKK
jgi:hypothetical protein